MTAEMIVEQILSNKPDLPADEVLEMIAFLHNEEAEDDWNSVDDLNEELRDEVVDLLDAYFEQKDTELRPILRFLLEQETLNCSHGGFCSDNMRPLFDYLADFEELEDVITLKNAIHDSSFDANLALDKYKLFMNGFQPTLDYVLQHYEDGETHADDLRFYAECFGFDQPGWEPPRFNPDEV